MLYFSKNVLYFPKKVLYFAVFLRKIGVRPLMLTRTSQGEPEGNMTLLGTGLADLVVGWGDNL